MGLVEEETEFGFLCVWGRGGETGTPQRHRHKGIGIGMGLATVTASTLNIDSLAIAAGMPWSLG